MPNNAYGQVPPTFPPALGESLSHREPVLKATSHTSAEQTAQASSLMEKERAQSQDACKVGGWLRHGYEVQTDIAREVTETATPPGVRDCPSAFVPRIRRQASDDVAIGSGLRAEIDKGKRLGGIETPPVSSSAGQS